MVDQRMLVIHHVTLVVEQFSYLTSETVVYKSYVVTNRLLFRQS